MNQANRRDDVMELARKVGVFRLRDLMKKGVYPEAIRALWMKGLLVRRGRGLYELAERKKKDPHHDLAVASKWVPKGVVCLLSALHFHKVLKNPPKKTWMAVHFRSSPPKVSYPPMSCVQFSGAAMTHEIEEYTIEGVPVKVYSLAKTIVDCFRFRRKVGLENAKFALEYAWKKKLVTTEQLWKIAELRNARSSIGPFLEALAGIELGPKLRIGIKSKKRKTAKKSDKKAKKAKKAKAKAKA